MMLAKITALFMIALLTTMALPAQAYIDPGAGSLIVQSLIGAAAAAAALLGVYFARVRNFLGRLRTRFTERKSTDNRP